MVTIDVALRKLVKVALEENWNRQMITVFLDNYAEADFSVPLLQIPDVVEDESPEEVAGDDEEVEIVEQQQRDLESPQHPLPARSSRFFADDEASDDEEVEGEFQGSEEEGDEMSGFIDDEIVYEDDDEEEEEERPRPSRRPQIIELDDELSREIEEAEEEEEERSICEEIEDSEEEEEEEDGEDEVLQIEKPSRRFSIANLVAFQLETNLSSPSNVRPEKSRNMQTESHSFAEDIEKSESDDDEDDCDAALLSKIARLSFLPNTNLSSDLQDPEDQFTDDEEDDQFYDHQEQDRDTQDQVAEEEEDSQYESPIKLSIKPRRLIIEEDEDEDEEELPNFNMVYDQTPSKPAQPTTIKQQRPAEMSKENAKVNRNAVVVDLDSPVPVSRLCKHGIHNTPSSSLSLACGLSCNDQKNLRPSERLRLICPTTMSRQHFSQYRSELSYALYTLYNETVFESRLPKDLPISWNIRLRTTAGRALMTTKGSSRTASIELSEKVIDEPVKLQNTLCHEMCHVATFFIDAINDGHGPVFKKWAVQAEKLFPSLRIKTCHNYEIEFKFRYQCETPHCGNIIGRHSRSIHADTHACARCGGRFILLKPAKQTH